MMIKLQNVAIFIFAYVHGRSHSNSLCTTGVSVGEDHEKLGVERCAVHITVFLYLLCYRTQSTHEKSAQKKKKNINY